MKAEGITSMVISEISHGRNEFEALNEESVLMLS